MTGAQSGSRRLVSLAVAVLVIAAFQAVGRAYYREFRIPQGLGMTHLLPDELAFLALFTVFGCAAWALLTAALARTSMLARVEGSLREWARRRAWVTAAAGVLVASACLLVGRGVLGGSVVTDDEHVYRFVAQTLRAGSLTAPSPGQDLPFFAEQFVVLNESERYGKYPLGHPLVLAAAQSAGLEALAMPLVTGLVAWPLAAMGWRLLGPSATLLALALFGSSPLVIFTGGTYLSQPTSALCLACGCAFLLAAEQARRRAWLPSAAAGIALAFGVLTRPLPGVLFAAAALAWVAWRHRVPALRDGRLAALGAPLLASVGALLAVNRLQAGSALTSGYQTAYGLEAGGAGLVRLLTPLDLPNGAMSIAASLMRLDAWLFGWPLSLLFVPFARRRGAHALPWLMLAAALAYRLVSPKAGVGTTGPQYFLEVAPLLCLLTADGLARLVERAGIWRHGLAAAVVLAGTCVSLTMFVPPRLAELGRAGRAQRAVWDLIQLQVRSRALVFHEGVVPPWTGLSWAYFPRCNGPRLDDDVLFVRLARAEGLDANLEFWRRRFPERSAWYFGWDRAAGPYLVELESLVGRETGRAR
jgi:hypothetical protein